MDSLQQQFGGEPDIISKRPKWVPFIAFCIGGAIITGVFGYFWWPTPAPAPLAEEIIEQPLGAQEVETYRATLPKTTVAEESTTPLQTGPQKTSVTLAEDGAEVSTAAPAATFVPPTAATPVAVMTTGGNSGEVSVSPNGSTQTVYAEGDSTVDGVVITQPDATELRPIDATVVVAAVDVATNQMMVTSGGEVLTLQLAGGRLQTKDGKLVSITSITTNDILAVSGDQRADAPVVQVRTASLIGVQEIIDAV